MKRIGKILLSGVLVLAFCLCLCSCAALDELKASRAELVKDANGETVILFRNRVYRSAASLLKDDTPLQITYAGTAYLAEPDVPALLLASFGISCPYNEDASVIFYPEAYASHFSSASDHHNDEYFVREDKFDELRALLEGDGMSRWCTQNWDDVDNHRIYPLISSGYTDLLNTLTALADESNVSLPEVQGAGFYAFSHTLFRCDEDVSFRFGQYSIVRLSGDGSGTAPVKETYLYNGASDRAALVPEQYLSTVDRMIEEFDLFESTVW